MQIAIAYILELIGLASTIIGIVQFIRSQVQHAAQEEVPYSIEHKAQNILDELQSGLFGLSHLAQSILDARDQVNEHTDAALDGLSVSATIPTQPDWYTAPTTPPDVASIAYEVWWNSGFNAVQNTGDTAYHEWATVLTELWDQATRKLGTRGLKHPNNPYFSLVGNEPADVGFAHLNWGANQFTVMPGLPDWSALLSTDTPLSFLTRTQPSLSWTLTGPATILADGETVWLDANNGISDAWWRFDVTQADLLAIYASGASTPPALITAPVWPGEASVTYGASHALSDGLTITEAMHGLIFTITSHPTGAGKYGFGSVNSWQHSGAVIFADDADHYERAESYGIDTQIIVPRTMAEAASAIVRLNSGWAGTVRSWIRTS